MCKIVALTNMSKIKIKKSSEAIGNILLDIEKDGFGYAVQGANGVFGEKCVKDKFRSRLGFQQEIRLPIVKKEQSKFGKTGALTGPGIFHGRTSTNVKGLLNCHPMQREDWHLIHNGVVDDKGPKYDKKTQNDSEDVLHRLIQGISEVESKLEGYYAFAAIDPGGLLHVARDGIATLHMAWSSTYETYIIATTEKVLRAVASAIKAKIGPVDEIKEDLYMIFKGNELVHQQSIKPLGYTSVQSSYAGLSLGRALGHTHPKRLSQHMPPLSSQTLVSEAWPGNVLNEIEASETRSIEAVEDEAAYYQRKHEIDNMDAAYRVYNDEAKEISILEFKKMDYISQEACTVIRPDGTVMEPWENKSKAV
jgi:hypothetical protein